MQVPEVVWFNGQRGSWCQAIVEFLCEGFTHRMDIKEVQGDGAIVVIKADQVTDINTLARDLTALNWLLLVITANEDGLLGIAVEDGLSSIFVRESGLVLRNSKIWLQTPHKHQNASRYIPWGWTPGCAVEVHSKKLYDFSFCGQITHIRREQCLEALYRSEGSKIITTTKGFAQGHSQEDYYRILAGTKVAPCPSGPITVDSMRVCEALQLGAIPIVDCASPTGPYPEYWPRVFGALPPFLYIVKWEHFPRHLQTTLDSWDEASKEVAQWWRMFKESLRLEFRRDLESLGAL